MDNETKEILSLILDKVTSLDSKVTSLEQDVSSIKSDVKSLQSDMREVKHTVKKTGWQVDTLYDWVDSIDLRAKETKDILDNLPLAK